MVQSKQKLVVNQNQCHHSVLKMWYIHLTCYMLTVTDRDMLLCCKKTMSASSRAVQPI